MKKILFILLLIVPLFSYANDDGLWFESSQITFAKHGEGWENPKPSRTRIYINLNDNIFEGIIMIYTNKVVTLTLRKKIEKIENNIGISYSWSFNDDRQNYGVCTVYMNNDNTCQLLIAYDYGLYICYDMSPLVR